MYAYVVCLCVYVCVCVLIKRKMGAEYEKHKPLKLVQTVPFFRLLLLKKKVCPEWWVQPRKKKKATEAKWTLPFPTWLHSLVIVSSVSVTCSRDCPDCFRIKWELSLKSYRRACIAGKQQKWWHVTHGWCTTSGVPRWRLQTKFNTDGPRKGKRIRCGFCKTFPTHFKWFDSMKNKTGDDGGQTLFSRGTPTDGSSRSKRARVRS